MSRLKIGLNGDRGWQTIVCCVCGYRMTANGTPSKWTTLRSGKVSCCTDKRPAQAKQVAA